jgi:hypothetical protein
MPQVAEASDSTSDAEDLGSETSSAPEDEDEPGCASIYTLHHLTEASFEALVQRVWPGEFESALAAAAAPDGGDAAAAGGGGPTLTGVTGRRLRVPVVPQQILDIITGAGAGELAEHLRALGAAAGAAATEPGSGGAASGAPPPPQPFLTPAEWWVQHLADVSRTEDALHDAAADVRLLRWVYGAIASAQADEFAARQASLRAGAERGAALLALLDKLAACWRRLQRQHDRRRQLDDLRRRAKAGFARVRGLEQRGGHAAGEHAAAFLDALFDNLCQAAPGAPTSAAVGAGLATPAGTAAAGGAAVAGRGAGAKDSAASPEHDGGSGARDQDGCPPPGSTLPGGGTLPPPPSLRLPAPAADAASAPASALQVRLGSLAPLYQCGPAVAAVLRAPELALEASQHYARALLERELSVLALAEAMLADDAEAALARQAAASDRLARQRLELAAAEAEHARLLTDGPAAHRKRDALDKATKEAEHRERAADALARVEASKGLIAADEAEAAAAAAALAGAAAELARVRDQAGQIAARRRNLSDLNAQLLEPVGGAPKHAALAAASAAAVHAGGGGAGGEGKAGRADAGVDAGMSLRAQRLECLMYRVLWASEAIKLFRGQYTPHGPPSRQYSLLVRATNWARARVAEHEAASRALEDEAAELHTKLQELGWWVSGGSRALLGAEGRV